MTTDTQTQDADATEAPRLVLDHFAEDDYVTLVPGAPLDEAQTRAAVLGSSGIAATGRIGGDIAFVGGAIILWRGLAQAWMVASPLGRDHADETISAVRALLRGTMTHFDLGRVQFDLLPGDQLAEQLVRALGFEFECRFKRYGPDGEDYDRYVLFPAQQAEK